MIDPDLIPIAISAGDIGWTALVSVLFSSLVLAGWNYLLADRLAERDANRQDQLAEQQADREFRLNRRQEIRTLLSEFDGRLVETASDLRLRIRQFQRGDVDPDWLAMAKPTSSGYFFRSTVYRFLAFFRIVVLLERKAIFFEPEVSTDSDRRFLPYAKALELVMTDVRLFANTGYDESRATAHFFRDELRTLVTVDSLPDDEPLTYDFFQEQVVRNRKFRPLFRFFAGLDRNTSPLRWDRLAALDLLLMSFLDRLGFEHFHRSGAEDYAEAAQSFADPRIKGQVIPTISGWNLLDGSSVRTIEEGLNGSDTG